MYSKLRCLTLNLLQWKIHSSVNLQWENARLKGVRGAHVEEWLVIMKRTALLSV